MRSSWDIVPWAELEFESIDPHLFHYQYDSSGDGDLSQFTASAFGDLDCDGHFSTFVFFGDIEGGEVQGSPGFYIEHELE